MKDFLKGVGIAIIALAIGATLGMLLVKYTSFLREFLGV